jgi:hypothetical protein
LNYNRIKIVPEPRRTLEELKQIALELSANLGKTPSQRQLSSVVKINEYPYYGMTVKEFQEYCGLEANKSGIDRKIPDDSLLRTFYDLCVAEKMILNQLKLRKCTRDGKFPIYTLEQRWGGMRGIQEKLLAYAIENNCDGEIRNLPGWKIDLDIATNPIASSMNLGSVGKLFKQVCDVLSQWDPAMRRSSEEAYKSELSNYLKQSGSVQIKKETIREEKGDSRCDIAIGENIGIEVKKSPSLAEYDRCFGQIARHLKSYQRVAVVIFDVPRQEQFEDFCQMVDKYYSSSVCVIKNC